jgi:hypothetical protein
MSTRGCRSSSRRTRHRPLSHKLFFFACLMSHAFSSTSAPAKHGDSATPQTHARHQPYLCRRGSDLHPRHHRNQKFLQGREMACDRQQLLAAPRQLAALHRQAGGPLAQRTPRQPRPPPPRSSCRCRFELALRRFASQGTSLRCDWQCPGFVGSQPAAPLLPGQSRSAQRQQRLVVWGVQPSSSKACVGREIEGEDIR